MVILQSDVNGDGIGVTQSGRVASLTLNLFPIQKGGKNCATGSILLTLQLIQECFHKSGMKGLVSVITNLLYI